MGRVWAFLTYVHSAAGPAVMLLYPLYASIMALESPSKLDDEQWLAYWILYSFVTLVEILLQPILEWIPIWYTLKLAFVAWLVLPHFRGSAFIYDKFVREKIIKKYGTIRNHVHQNKSTNKSPNGKSKGKKKFVDFITSRKGEHEAY